MKDLVYLKNVVSLSVDTNICTGCGLCLAVCPHGVLAMNERHVQIRNRDACMECGACRRNCPVGAVSVEAGVGCAAAVISGMLNWQNNPCSCSADPKESTQGNTKSTCCS